VQGDLTIGGHALTEGLEIVRSDNYPRMADERLRAVQWLCGFNSEYRSIVY
jgi:hypothetical protein